MQLLDILNIVNLTQIFTVFLAILALGFLIFIHELGHYIVARRTKMRVEVFSIGFGKPLFSWMRKGVKWQVCMLPFGGYVKIAGMHAEKGIEPSDIPDGYFGKKPWDRIKVAFAGPLVNIVFALIVFTGVYLIGGREKPFSHYTHKIGWIDEKSELYQKGIRPGDEIVELGDRPYNGVKDLLFNAIGKDSQTRIKGYKIDYLTQQKKEAFDYTLNNYALEGGNPDFQTIGIVSPAKYLIYNPEAMQQNSLTPSTSILNSGLKQDDRLVWVNGELIFSSDQLNSILNESTTYLSVLRKGKVIHTRVPRVQLDSLRLNRSVKNELNDWKYETGIKQSLASLYFIPYDLNSNLQVKNKITFIDKEEGAKAFIPCQRCASYFPLERGDKIIAIDGQKVSTSFDLLQKIQTKNALIIVQNDLTSDSSLSADMADAEFDKQFPTHDLNKIVSSIGTKNEVKSTKHFALLSPIKLQKLKDIEDKRTKTELTNLRQSIEDMEDDELKTKKLVELNKYENSYMLGIMLQDKQVLYNPSPFALFGDVVSEIQRTFTGLVLGDVSPKHMSGPVGIMYVVQHSWSLGIAEVLYWIGMISLNLGLLNLLPIPVLDGGHITLSCIEMVTKKPIKAKTMERIILPFVVLLIGYTIYITFHDITRIFF